MVDRSRCSSPSASPSLFSAGQRRPSTASPGRRRNIAVALAAHVDRGQHPAAGADAPGGAGLRRRARCFWWRWRSSARCATARAAGSNLGFTRIQPSEIMKIAVPLMLAWYFHQHEAALKLRDYAVAAVLLALPVGLDRRQPDLGTALLIFAAGFFVIFLAGLCGRLIAGLWRGWAGEPALPLVDAARLPAQAGAHPARSRRRTRWARATTSSSPRSPSDRGACSARGGCTAPRRSWTSCPSAPPISSSRCSARSSGCLATRADRLLYGLIDRRAG